MKQPILVVMAAGMGSRYGGLKQMDPVGKNGEVIMDYSLFDARRAGFGRVIFIIKKSMDALFREKIGNRVAAYMDVAYAYQDVADLPDGYAPPAGREKPWGTAHAILSARHLIDAPFAVINADDFYGSACFSMIYDDLTNNADDDKYRYCMAGYRLKNTVTEHGSVARGVCTADESGCLVKVREHTNIVKDGDAIRFSEDGGESWTSIDGASIVSMNLWGFSESFVKEGWARFPAFLDRALAENPLKGEYFLPSVVTQLLEEEKATVKILPCPDKWYGVTYQEDKAGVVEAIEKMHEAGRYPTPLWGG